MDASRILLVEDNEDDEVLTLRAFAKNGFKNPIDVARDGEEALDYLLLRGRYASRSPASPPDLVLLDLKLPKLDGFEVLAQIRAHPAISLVPVVLLTSSPQESDVAMGYRSGANAYIQKPVEFSDFVKAVGHVGAFWLMLNVRPPPSAGG